MFIFGLVCFVIQHTFFSYTTKSEENVVLHFLRTKLLKIQIKYKLKCRNMSGLTVALTIAKHFVQRNFFSFLNVHIHFAATENLLFNTTKDHLSIAINVDT